MEMKMEKKLTNIGLAAILGLAVFAGITGIASADTYYNESGKYIEGINVTVNTSSKFNVSDCCTPLEFLINNTLNESATSFNVTTPGLTTNATAGVMDNDSWFWVNASMPGTYWINVSNNENSSEYVYFTVEYSSITITTYNEAGNYIEGINVSVNTSEYFNTSYINVPLTFQINNTLNPTAANFSVANQSGLTTNATEKTLHANDSFWVNATEAGTYCINVFNKDNQSEYVSFTVEYSNTTITIETIRIRPKTLNLGSKGVFTAFIMLPEDFPAGYNVTDINISTVECEGAPADSKKRIDGDKFIAKFNRQNLTTVPEPDIGGNVTLNVTGKFYDGTPFEGNDTIRVINKTAGGWGHKFAIGHLFDEVKKLAKKVHKKFSTSDDDAIAIPGNPGKATKRVFVSYEGSSESTSIVKKTFAVQHGFEDGFTVAVGAKGLAALENIPGIQLEAVPLYHVSGKPVCGNDIIEGGEKCGEPGLPDCPTGYVCENCKCVEETAPPERACYPSNQIPWGIVKVNGSSGGAGVKVAVLDTGVYKDHLDLKANIVDCRDATKRGIKEGCADRDGHGTHVAGTILANAGSDGQGIYGVAPNASLMAIKVCGPGGCWADDIAAGIRYAADNGANIISMSLGGDTQSSLIKDAIDYATGKGVLIVAAAGNDGPADGSIDYPGANVKVIAVGAVDSAEDVPSWSSRGVNPGTQAYYVEEREVEFGAPGVSVESTWKDGCYNTISGTSMSTPHVAGLAAKLWDTDAATTRTELQKLAKLHNLHTEGDDSATGFGLPIAPQE